MYSSLYSVNIIEFGDVSEDVDEINCKAISPHSNDLKLIRSPCEDTPNKC